MPSERQLQDCPIFQDIQREILIFNVEAENTAMQNYPESIFTTFAKECFGCWVVTTDPLLTSAKWVAYGTEVSVEIFSRIVTFPRSLHWS